jgi:TonB family protein
MLIVKPLLLRASLATALAASLLPVLPAAGADTSPAPLKLHVTVSPGLDALMSAMRDLHLEKDAQLPMTQRLERLAGARPSAETEAKLRAAFGTDRLYSIERLPALPGKVGYRATLFPLRYASPEGKSVDWTEGRLDISLNPAGTAMSMHGALESFAYEDKDSNLTVRGIAFDANQRRGYAGMWFGEAKGQVADVHIKGKGEAPPMDMRGMSFASRLVEKPKTVDMVYESGIKTIAMAGEQVDDLRFAMRFSGIDKKAMADLKAAGERQQNQLAGLSPEQQAEAGKAMMLAFGKAALSRGAAIELDDFSASYHGQKAALKGRVSFQGATAADLNDAKLLMKKLVARAEVRVPIALVREIAGAVVARQAAQQGGATDPQSIARLRESATDVVVGKLVGGGFARVENDVLVSTIEWRNSVLTANGKTVPLPAPQPAGKPPVAMAPGPGQVLQARLVEGSCTLPAYPEDVIAGDRPLRVRVDMTVGADGRVKRAAIGQPGGFADYERALLDAVQQCTYIPALRDGKPIEVSVSRQIVRAPGSRQP